MTEQPQGPRGINYVDYLQATLPGRQADLANKLMAIRARAEAQQQKNYSAPVVSGSSGGVSNAYTGPVMNNFPTTGKKVAPVAGRVSQNWGKSRISYAAGRHTGTDFGVGVGTRVNSAANGVVIRVGNQGAYGNTVEVRHPDGYTSLYGHLSGANVKVGQRVKAGQQIARSGNTGRSTGAHLHFEVRSRDRYGGDVNPHSWYSR